MLDELPMIYSALVMSYSIIEHRTNKPKYYPWLPLGMILHATITTCLVASPAIAPEYSSPLLQFLCFHFSFAVLQIFLIVETTKMSRKTADPESKRTYARGIGLWVLGIFCWILDYTGCDTIWEGDDGLRKKYLIWTVSIAETFPSFIVNGLSRLGFAATDSISLGVPNPQLHAWWHFSAVRMPGVTRIVIYPPAKISFVISCVALSPLVCI
jgi:dihydroceramidase